MDWCCRPIILGSLGVSLSVAMVSAISQHGILYDSDGVLIDRDSTIGNDSLSLTASQRLCTTDVLLQKKVDEEPFLKRTVFETLLQVAGVRQAFKVLFLSHLFICIGFSYLLLFASFCHLSVHTQSGSIFHSIRISFTVSFISFTNFKLKWFQSDPKLVIRPYSASSFPFQIDFLQVSF